MFARALSRSRTFSAVDPTFLCGCGRERTPHVAATTLQIGAKKGRRAFE